MNKLRVVGTVSAPAFGEALRFWFKLGLISFGGPTGQIAIMHAELVERRGWISENRFLHALSYCMLLPGPEAQQLAIYIGWLMHRTRGGIAAGALFVLPSMFILLALSYVYVLFGSAPFVAAAFYGLKPAVLGIVAAAVLKIGGRALKNETMWMFAALAFLALFFLDVPFPLVIVTAALLGVVGGRLWKEKFQVIAAPTVPAALNGGNARYAIDDHSESPLHSRPAVGRAVKVLGIGLALWWTPVLLSGWLLGAGHAIVREGLFFSKAAMVTIGGAYAVLPYVSQQAVETHQWLSAAQMIDGLGLAETTPGPLIMVLQFVGFMGAWNHPGELPATVAAAWGALLTTWTTFVPSFLWIFLGAPYIEQLRGNATLTAALSAVTAAVVGVVLNLALWFGMHVLYSRAGGVDGFAVLVSVASFVAIARLRVSVVVIVLVAAVLGVVHMLATGA